MTQSVHPVPPRLSILRRREVEARVKLSRSTIYLRIAEHSFPTPIRLGTGHAVGLRRRHRDDEVRPGDDEAVRVAVEQEIEAWLQEQVAASRKAAE